MAVHTFDEIKELVKNHNKSTQLSNDTIICLIWKESGFDDASKSSSSSATGLMQMTKAAVADVNRNTPAGVHFEHSELTDPEKNIECGTLYLDLRIRWAKQIEKGVDAYGTGPGYSTNIWKCKKCLAKDSEHFQTCLDMIHK
jgi:soluble lytic murein transglycosylase-like protein